MNIAIRYTRSGNTKKIADAVAKAVGEAVKEFIINNRENIGDNNGLFKIRRFKT